MFSLICSCFITCWFINHVLSLDISNDGVGIKNIDYDSNNNKLLNEYYRRNLLTSPNILSMSDKQSLLNQHNMFRSAVSNGSTPNQPSSSNMNYLFWDDGLAKVASNYASKCLWTHNSNRAADLLTLSSLSSFPINTNLGVGENLYMTSANTISSIDSLNNGIRAFYNEYSSYTYSTTFQYNAGHYSQLIWANTRYVGCGYYQCPSVLVSGDTNGYYLDGATILVCNYYPAGNWGGQYPYKLGTSCSQCDGDRTKCDSSQCGGCLSSTFSSDGSIIPNNCNNGLGIFVDGASSTTSSSTTTTTTTTTSSTPATTTTTTTQPPVTTSSTAAATTSSSSSSTTTTTTTTSTPAPTKRNTRRGVTGSN